MSNTKWFKWSDRNQITNSNQAAVYFLAFSESDISGNGFTFIKEIIYIGMTISHNGLKGRLNQFESGMIGKNGIHGGAERVRFKHNNAELFLKNLYISARIFELSETRNTSNDWRIKGDCVGHEYKSFAEYMDKFDSLPEFNDQSKSKKK